MRLRFGASAAIALWLTTSALGVESRSAAGRDDRRASRIRTEDAFRTFADVLMISRSAAAPNAHWRVELAGWGDAQAAWERIAPALPSPARGLQRCWPPLRKARDLIERANRLFLDARDHAGHRGLEILAVHDNLIRQAEGPLRDAEQCEWAARDDPQDQ